MNSYLYVKFFDISYTKLINKLSTLNIALYEIKELDKNIIIKIKSDDYEVIQKYIKTFKYEKVKYTGLMYIKKSIQRYYFIFLAIIVFFLLIIGCSFIITDVNVIHNNPKLVSLVTDELAKNNIKKFTIKKSYAKLSLIKEKIKNDNLDKIEWLEITKKGMKYIVRVEERIITKETEKDDYCHIVAKKDGVILGSEVKKGENKVILNDYVKKGDILISGDITLNEAVVNNVCAQGSVYAESWYQISVKVPMLEKIQNKTGKKRYNIVYNHDDNDHVIFRERLKNYVSSNKVIFDALGIKIFLRSDEEIEDIVKELNEKEALDKAILLAKEKVKLKLDKNDKIIDEKVLQKSINNSTMNVEIFIIAKEQIGEKVIARKEKNDI